MRAIIYHPVDKEYLAPNSEKNKLAMELADLFWEENNRQIPISIQVGGKIENDVYYVFCLQSYEDSPEYLKL